MQELYPWIHQTPTSGLETPRSPPSRCFSYASNYLMPYQLLHNVHCTSLVNQMGCLVLTDSEKRVLYTGLFFFINSYQKEAGGHWLLRVWNLLWSSSPSSALSIFIILFIIIKEKIVIVDVYCILLGVIWGLGQQGEMRGEGLFWGCHYYSHVS